MSTSFFVLNVIIFKAAGSFYINFLQYRCTRQRLSPQLLFAIFIQQSKLPWLGMGS